MSYVALYRKYRSQSFGEVIGQQHVTTVLQNAIRLGRIAHAYLFCGPRGCGKTSTARLLARALNCQASDKPTSEPCGVCDMCVRIREGSAIDVIEMDAASETGIDDVREKIIENAKYAPAEARYKVYIIDEVHDLSLKAFDSLLKTIEEPPAHVVFVLATTEAHKVPITIRSRCQRMDFRRGTLDDLIGNLKRVLDKEGIEYEADAIAAVARAAEGSFRDSLSLLEQVLAYTDGKLTAQAVHDSIGTVGPAMLDGITRVLAADDLAAAFLRAGAVVESGKDVKQTLVALQAHLRDLLVAGVANNPSALADVSPERFAQLKEQARGFTPPQLLKMLDVLAEAERDIRFTNQHRLLLERAFWSILPSSLAAADHGPPTADDRPADAATRRRGDGAAEGKERPKTEHIAPTVQAPAEPVAVVEEVSPPRTSGATVSLEEVRRVWSSVRNTIVQRSKTAGLYFGSEYVESVEGGFVYVAFPSDLQREKVERPKARELVEQVLAEKLGVSGLKVKCLLADSPPSAEPPAPESPAPLDLSDGPSPGPQPHRNGNGASAPQAGDSAAEDPDEQFLHIVVEQFDGRVIDEE